MRFISKIGDDTIKLFSQKFGKNLLHLEIERNCFEKCSKISDESIKHLKSCPNLEKLNIIYSRKFKELFHIHVANYLKNLKFLGIRDCPL